MSEQIAEAVFHAYGRSLLRELGRGPLDDKTINQVGRRSFGPLWRGAHAQHETDLSRPGYYVMNTARTARSPGVHWLGVYVDGVGDISIYDSFARSGARMLHAATKKYRRAGRRVLDSDRGDAEQFGDSAVCGQLSLSWLMTVRDLGAAAARKV